MAAPTITIRNLAIAQRLRGGTAPAPPAVKTLHLNEFLYPRVQSIAQEARMIPTALLALVLVLPAITARPALAVTFAECQAFLCLPGGFPPSECTPAKAAVLRRLARFEPALPPWSSCAAQFGWDSANLSHTEDWQEECAPGDTLTNGQCHGTDADGCDYSYTPQQKVEVQVVVDGSTSFQPNHTLTHTTSAAGTPAIDPSTCTIPPPPEETWNDGACPPGMISHTTYDGRLECYPYPGFFSPN